MRKSSSAKQESGRCNPEKNLHPIYGVGGCDCGYWIEDAPERDPLMPPVDGVPPAPEESSGG